jgi:hypothetical protein
MALPRFQPERVQIDTRRFSANAESPIFVLRTDVLLNLLSGQGCSLAFVTASQPNSFRRLNSPPRRWPSRIQQNKSRYGRPWAPAFRTSSSPKSSHRWN